MRIRFWMWIHDWAENIWHYAYYKAYPPEKRESGPYQYNICYFNSRTGALRSWDGTEIRVWTKDDA